MYTEQPASVWMAEYLGDLMHERDGMRQDLLALKNQSKELSAGVMKRRRSVLERLNALNSLLDFPADVLDRQSEQDKLDVERGIKPERFNRIEEFLRAHPEPKNR